MSPFLCSCCRNKPRSWQFLYCFTGGVALPSHEAWRQQDVGARRGHLCLTAWPLTSPASRSVQEPLPHCGHQWSLPVLCFIDVGLSKVWSLQSLREIIYSWLHGWMVNNDWTLFFCLYFLHFCDHIWLRRYFNPHWHPDRKWMVSDQELISNLLLSADLGEMILNMLWDT